MGDHARKLEAKIKSSAKSQAPFDLATELVDELHTAPFKYSVDVSNLPCEAISTTECFATYMTGFCQYYATTMAVLMRDMGVPARIVEGFLPGTVDRNSGNETIPFSSAHAWVEVYFPGFGWTMFDPTGGGLSQVAPLPSGPPLPSATPGSSLRQLAQPSDKDDVHDRCARAGWIGHAAEPAPGSVHRGRGAPAGDRRPPGVRRLAARTARCDLGRRRLRLGHPHRLPLRVRATPHPDGLRVRRLARRRPAERETRARDGRAGQGRVRLCARQIFGEERIASLRAAQRRLRVSLLRLAFHRKDRPRRR